MAIVVAYLILFFLVEAVHDWGVIMWGQELTKLKGKSIGYYSNVWHIAGAVQTILLGLICFGTECLIELNPYVVIAWVLVVRWVVLDMSLNVLRGLPLFYVGKTSTIDKIYQYTGYPTLTMALSKLIVVSVLIYLTLTV